MEKNFFDELPKLFLASFQDTWKVFIKDQIKVEEEEIKNIIGKFIGIGIETFFPKLSTLIIGKLLTTESEIKKIDRQVSKLIREPIKTGLNQLKIANTLSITSNINYQYLKLRYLHALENFDKAYNLSSDEEKPYIDLLRGITTLKIEGGQNESVYHFKNFQKYYLEVEATCEKEEVLLRNKIFEVEETIKKFKTPNDEIKKTGSNWTGIDVSTNYVKKQQLLFDLERYRKKETQIAKMREEVKSIGKSILITIELLENT